MHRIGQIRPVVVHMLVMEDTVEVRCSFYYCKSKTLWLCNYGCGTSLYRASTFHRAIAFICFAT